MIILGITLSSSLDSFFFGFCCLVHLQTQDWPDKHAASTPDIDSLFIINVFSTLEAIAPEFRNACMYRENKNPTLYTFFWLTSLVILHVEGVSC